MRIAIGDVHGCYEALKCLLHDELKIQKSDEIYFVGDLISKGTNSLNVIEHIIDLTKKGYCVRSVLGNHEYRLLKSYYTDFRLFEAYLVHYNCTDILNGELNILIEFISNFPFYISLEDWIIVHTQLGKEQNYNQSDARFLFGDKNFKKLYMNGDIENKNQVIGHTVRSLDNILMDCMMTSNIINVDGGCVYPDFGYLCGLNLDDFTLTYHKKK